MVTAFVSEHWLSSWLLAEQAAGPLIERLDPPRRAAVVMSLLALVLTGLLLVTIVMLGARWVRRQAQHIPESRFTIPASQDRPRRGLRKPLDDITPGAKSDETVYINRGASDTKID